MLDITKEYLREQKKAGFKVGDKVKITRDSYSGEDGWNNNWEEFMGCVVGGHGIIVEIDEEEGFGIALDLSCNNIDWRVMGFSDVPDYDFPFFVLEKVEKTQEDKYWNSICLKCGAKAYQGIGPIECSRKCS